MDTPHVSHAGERGAALLLALITAAALAVLAAALMALTSTDVLIAGSSRAAQETLHAVDAAVARSVGELAPLPDWSLVLAAPPGNLTASFDEGVGVVRAPDGRTFSVGALTASRQAASHAVAGPAVFGADAPQWRLYARASLQSLLPAGLIAPPAYTLLWVADDGADGDGDAERDANGQLLVHGEAYGVAGARRVVDAAIARAVPGAVRLLAWKEDR